MNEELCSLALDSLLLVQLVTLGSSQLFSTDSPFFNVMPDQSARAPSSAQPIAYDFVRLPTSLRLSLRPGGSSSGISNSSAFVRSVLFNLFPPSLYASLSFSPHQTDLPFSALLSRPALRSLRRLILTCNLHFCSCALWSALTQSFLHWGISILRCLGSGWASRQT